MSRNFTMRKFCSGCGSMFTITSSASVFCQDKACKNKRRRKDYADMKAKKRSAPVGTDGHLERALKSGD